MARGLYRRVVVTGLGMYLTSLVGEISTQPHTFIMSTFYDSNSVSARRFFKESQYENVCVINVWGCAFPEEL